MDEEVPITHANLLSETFGAIVDELEVAYNHVKRDEKNKALAVLGRLLGTVQIIKMKVDVALEAEDENDSENS